MKVKKRPMTTREVAAVLAGLRLLQRELAAGAGLPGAIHDIYEYPGVRGLSAIEIDRLCERVNLGEVDDA